MKYKLQWKEAVALAKQGSINGFEEVYILTYKNVGTKVLSIVKENSIVWDLLFETYVEVYQNIEEMPEGIKGKDWIISIAERRALEKMEGKNIEKKKVRFVISEEKAATIILRVEEELGLLKEEEKESNKIATVIKVVVTLILITLCSASVYKVYNMVRNEQKVSANSIIIKINNTDTKKNVVPTVEKTKKQIEPTTEQAVTYDPGWLITDDGMLYYINDDLEKVIGLYEIENFEFNFNENGELVYLKNKDKDYEILQDTIQNDGSWVYYLLKNYDLGKYNLYRVSEDEISGNWKEFILEDIDDYYIIENGIIYMQEGSLKYISDISEKSYVRQEQNIHLLKKEDGFYIANELDFIVDAQVKDSHMQVEDRIYRIKEGRIKYVKQNNLPIKGVSFYIGDDHRLYWKNSKGEGGQFVGEGLSIDSFCIVDQWVYYSVCTRIEQDARYSQIRRISTDGMTRENISDEFVGNMANMYYYQSVGRIYGEYLPQKSQYGKIAVISLAGTIYVIEDDNERVNETTTGEDMLELIMVIDQDIYCYWHDCDWKNKNGVQILWTKPIILSNENKQLLIN